MLLPLRLPHAHAQHHSCLAPRAPPRTASRRTPLRTRALHISATSHRCSDNARLYNNIIARVASWLRRARANAIALAA